MNTAQNSPRLLTLLSLELRRALGKNPWFWISLGIGCVLAAWAAALFIHDCYGSYELAIEYWHIKNYGTQSCFANWLPVRYAEAPAGAFLVVWPLLAALPYSWVIFSDASSGILAQQYERAKPSRVFTSKIIAAAIAGMLAVVIPLLLNLIIHACVYPADVPLAMYVATVNVWHGMPLSALFYTNPLAACVVWTIFCAGIAALWAAGVCALSRLVSGFVEALIGSYLAIQVLSYIGQQLGQILLSSSLRDLAIQVMAGFDYMHIIQFNIVSYFTLGLQVFVLIAFVAAVWRFAARKELV